MTAILPFLGYSSSKTAPNQVPLLNPERGGDEGRAPLPDPVVMEEANGEGYFGAFVVGVHSTLSDLWALRHVKLKPMGQRFTNQELLAGRHITKAFVGSRLFEADPELVDRACRRARSLARQHPVPILGRFGQGKSSLINSLLREEKAQCGRHEATTFGVVIHRLDAGNAIGEVLLCDTQGWEQGKTRTLLDQYKAVVGQETGQHNLFPDVIVFVVAGTPQGLRELSTVIERQNLAKAYAEFRGTAQSRGVLLPVITFADAVQDDAHAEDAAKVREKLVETIRRRGKDDMDIMDPVYVSNLTSKGVDELRTTIIEAVRKSFEAHGPWQPWHKQLQDDLVREVQAFEENNPDCETQADLVQRTTTAIAYAHGQEVRFTGAMWHLLPQMQSKVKGEANCSEVCCELFYRRPRCCLLSPFVAFFLLAVYVYWTVDQLLASVAKQTEAVEPPPLGTPAPGEVLDPVTRHYLWDVQGLTGATTSPLFDRGGVNNLQLVFEPQAAAPLRLMAPDGWTIQAHLSLDAFIRRLSGTFPVGGSDGGIALYNVTAGAQGFRTASVEIDSALQMAPPVPQPPAWRQWDVSGVKKQDTFNSESFSLAGVPGMQLQFVTMHDSPASGSTCALKLCAPGGWTLRYRLFMDGISRTYTHKFQDVYTLFVDSGAECVGSDDFAHARASYAQVGVEVLDAKPP